MRQNKVIHSLLAILIFVVATSLVSKIHLKLDLTEDQRYTLTEAAIETALKPKGEITVDVLLGGELPPEFTRLRVETDQILREFSAINSMIHFQIVDPLENEEESETIIRELQSFGLTPANITIEENARVSQEIFFPWAIVSHKNKTVKVPLLRNKLGATMEDRVSLSVQNLEYAFADAFAKLAMEEKKKIAVLRGNGELDDLYIADFLSSLKEYYNLGVITLDSSATNAEKLFKQLSSYDLAIIAKPTEPFTEEEKYLLDQYMVKGGKTLWLVDKVAIELDSLFNEKGSSLAYPRELNLDDLFFRYGVRINPVLVDDMYATQIVLATGDGNNTQYNPVPWTYHPMVFSRDNHPINKNMEALRLQFANSIDTLSNSYRKTILLRSSPLSKTDGTPKIISLDKISEDIDKQNFNDGDKPLAVLVEGDFVSAYANRIEPLSLEGAQKKGKENKMILVADGDLIKNQVRNNLPLELGYDKWTNNYYGNKDFLVNSVNYLLDESGLINIRNKMVKIPLLDEEKIEQHKRKWQLINIGVPMALVFLFAVFFAYTRKRKFAA